MATALFAVQGAYAAEEENITLSGVSVTAEALKIDTSTQDTPQTVNVVDHATIQNQAIRKVDDALRYTPGFQNPYGADYDTNWIKMRGFDVTTLVNGLPQYSEGYFGNAYEMYGMEKVEVLQGPSSSLYGSSQPGGVVNLVTKKPTKTPQHSVSIVGGTNNLLQAGLDYADNATEDGSKRYRLVAMVSREDSDIDYVHGWRGYLAPSFTIDINPQTSLTLLASYLHDDKIQSSGFMPIDGSLYPLNGHKVDPSTNYGDPAHDKFNRDQVNLGWELKHELNDTWSYKQTANFQYLNELARISAMYSQNPNPSYPWNNGALPYQVNRGTALYDGWAKTLSFDNNLTATWVKNNFDNLFQVGFDYIWTHNKWRGNGPLGVVEPYGPNGDTWFDPFNPPYDGLWSDDQVATGPAFIKKQQFGLYTQAQTIWNEMILAKAGARYDYVDMSTMRGDYPDKNFTPISDSLSKGHFSFNGGVMYLGPAGFSPYVNYSESFAASGSTAQTTLSGASTYTYRLLQPTESKQWEIGLKIAPENLDGYLNIAWFNIKQKNSLAQVQNASGGLVMIGSPEQKSQGVEVQLNAALTKHLTANLWYTYLDSYTTTADTAQTTLPVGLNARNTAGAYLSYNFGGVGLPGLTVGSGLRYIGKSTVAPRYGFTQYDKTPSVTLWDANFTYVFDKHWSLSGAFTNLTDREYIAAASAGFAYYGEGRTMRGTLTYSW